MSDIDFVVTWVDSSDENWLQQFKSYKFIESGDSSDVRFRNWDNFYFWFRGVEKFAPWVRKVHLITSGHLPEWLNTNHQKLNIIKHEDYIDSKFLPTFNSVVIENNIPLIDDISDKFVLFNDDFFITGPISPERFFQQDLPCDMAVINALSGDGNSAIIMNMLALINSNYDKRDVINNNLHKWYNFRYGIHILKNFLLIPWPHFTGFVEPHMPQPYLKSKMKKIFKRYNSEFMETNKFRFRNKSNINHYLYRYEHLVSGEFYPYNVYQDVSYHDVSDENYIKICEDIKLNDCKIKVINDSNMEDFIAIKNAINEALYSIFPEKCSFETDVL